MTTTDTLPALAPLALVGQGHGGRPGRPAGDGDAGGRTCWPRVPARTGRPSSPWACTSPTTSPPWWPASPPAGSGTAVVNGGTNFPPTWRRYWLPWRSPWPSRRAANPARTVESMVMVTAQATLIADVDKSAGVTVAVSDRPARSPSTRSSWSGSTDRIARRRVASFGTTWRRSPDRDEALGARQCRSGRDRQQ